MDDETAIRRENIDQVQGVVYQDVVVFTRRFRCKACRRHAASLAQHEVLGGRRAKRRSAAGTTEIEFGRAYGTWSITCDDTPDFIRG